MSEHYTPLFVSVRHSRKLAALPDDACELLYYRCLAISDAWGRLPGEPALLRAEAWPLLEHRGKTTAETRRCRDELLAAGLLELHRDDEHGEWLQVPDWEDKAGQVGKRDHRRKSRWPDPSEPTRANAGPSTDGAGPTPGQPGPSPVGPSRARAGAHARNPEPEPEPYPEPEPIAASPDGEPRAGQNGHGAKKPRAARTDDQGLVLAHFEARYLEAYGRSYAFAGPKDGALLKRLTEQLAKGDVPEAKARIDSAFASTWHLERGIDLGVVVNGYARFVVPAGAQLSGQTLSPAASKDARTVAALKRFVARHTPSESQA